MGTINTSLPNTLNDCGTSSEHVLISKDQDRQQLRGLLLAGAQSEPTAPVDTAYFDALRKRCGGQMWATPEKPYRELFFNPSSAQS